MVLGNCWVGAGDERRVAACGDRLAAVNRIRAAGARCAGDAVGADGRGIAWRTGARTLAIVEAVHGYR